MEFTGERFIPNSMLDKELEIEHLQRYYSIIDLIKGKVVVDAASGEGYGADLLAQHAQIVYGIDISQEAIECAREKYHKENLHFINASIERLPFPDNSIDAVVSFETIEHVNEDIQHSFMNEVRRVLNDDSILIISTPDKEVYADMRNYSNDFHVKEFYKHEFYNFLSAYFERVDFYYQRFHVASIITNNNSENLKVINSNEQKDFGKYIIAFCTNSANNFSLDASSAILDYNDKYNQLNFRILQLQDEVEERNTHINVLNKRLDISGAIIGDLKDKIDSFAEKNNELQSKIGSFAEKNNELQSKIGSFAEKNNELQSKIDDFAEKNNELQSKIDDSEKIIINKNDMVNKLIKNNEKLLIDLNNKDSLIASQNSKLDELEELYEQLEVIINNQHGHINQLLEKERMLNNILSSDGWKLLCFYYKIRDKLLPGNSKIRLFLKVFFKFIKHPVKIVNNLNKENLRKFLFYIKTEDLSMVSNRLDNVLNNNHFNKLKLDLVERQDIKDKLRFENNDKPLVSIIIPVYNQWEYTYSCLQSILENNQSIEYEVIVADDVSIDETVNIKKYIENIKVVRNESNLGFLRNCNNAARHAKGKYIVFLNNDTNVQKDWLRYLVELIERDPNIGMVGSKLVYPDGRLQEAGGIIWNDASGWNYGRLDDPEKPEYNYVKEVDYISGASIMIRSSLWTTIGGFDERYVPAYFEDSDLAFEVRKRGYKVVYQPKSVIVHFEGISHGTDTNSGLKSYQVKNKQKFLEKWKDVLGKEHFSNGQEVFWARDRSKNKKTILVIDHYVPQYDKDAGSRTTFHYLKLFVKLGLNVKFLGDNFYKHEPYASVLEDLGIEVLYGVWYQKDINKWLQDKGKHIDYTYLNRPHISIKYIDIIRKYTNSKVIYYGHDLHYLREYREYNISQNKELLKSSERWKKIEFELFSSADVIYYPSQVEIDEVNKNFSDITARAIPGYIFEKRMDKNTIPFKDKKDILFVGGFIHKPNVDGVLWFKNEIFPLILDSLPGIKFYVVGSNPPDVIKECQTENIIITGFVTDEELLGYYEKCRLAVVPLRYGAGVKGKVVEAMYYGVPLVTTSVGAEGLDNVSDILTVADNAANFSNALVELYNNYQLLDYKSKESYKYVLDTFSSNNALSIILKDITN